MPIGQLTDVKFPSAHNLEWPELDIDLAVEPLTHRERNPLINSVHQRPSSTDRNKR
jgi:hypothetical protein